MQYQLKTAALMSYMFMLIYIDCYCAYGIMQFVDYQNIRCIRSILAYATFHLTKARQLTNSPIH